MLLADVDPQRLAQPPQLLPAVLGPARVVDLPPAPQVLPRADLVLGVPEQLLGFPEPLALRPLGLAGDQLALLGGAAGLPGDARARANPDTDATLRIG